MSRLAKPLQRKKPRVSPTSRKVIERYEEAARSWALAGGGDMEEYKAKREEYEAARGQLLSLIHNLEWWIPLT